MLALAAGLPVAAEWHPAATPAAAAAAKTECSSLRPRYPVRAWRWGVQGYVLLRFDVEARGRTRNIRIVKSFPPGFFEREAMQVGRRICYESGASAASPREIVWRDVKVLVVYDLLSACRDSDHLIRAVRRQLAQEGIEVGEEIETIVVTADPPEEFRALACRRAARKEKRR